jgi:Putative porin
MNMYRSNRFKRSAAALLAAILISASFAAHADEADEREELEKLRATVLSLIDTLVKNHILPQDKADAMMREAESRATTELAQMPPPEVGTDGKKIVRVPYVPEAVKVQMRDQIKAEVLAETRNERLGGSGAADWPSRIQIEGDLRLRAENTRLNQGNTPAAAYFAADSYLTRAPDIWGNTSNGIHNFNTQESTNRTRLRARLGFNATVSEAVSAGLALSTGSSTTSPTSTNQTMGQGNTQNSGFFNKYSVVVDRAYIKYEPESWLNVSGGRVPNPFFGTDLVWADDLNFEGFALALKPRLNPLSSAFFTAGWFPLSTSVPNQTPRRSLVAAQAGIDWQIGQRDNRVKLAAALYDYHGIEGVRETQDYNLLNGMGPTDYGVRSEYGVGYRQRGNTLFRLNSINDPNYPGYLGLASSFRELDLTGTVDIVPFDPVHVVLTGDLVKNIGFNRDEIMSRTGYSILDGHTLGYMGRIQVGAPKMTKRGDWNVSLAYRYLGSDAVLDAFTNSDFGLGGTNSKGTILGMNYGVDKNTWVSARLLSSDLIDSMVPSTSASSFNTKFSVDLIQFDLNTRF